MKYPLTLLVAMFLITPPPKIPPRGSKTLYAPSDTIDAPAPTGYAPFFINYVGRHGARHVTNLKELSTLNKLLQAASDSGNLTIQGDSLQAKIARLLTVEKKYTPGDLTETGVQEQYGIGRRMRAHFPGLVSGKNDSLTVSYTEEARTRESAQSFLSALEDPACTDTHPNDSVRLRFFDLSPAYKAFVKSGPWKESFNRLVQTPGYLDIVKGMAHRFFTKGEPDPEAFAEGIYGAASIQAGLASEISASGFTNEEADIFSLLSGKEAAWLALIGGARDFLVKGPGADPEGIQVRIAVPLLVDLLQTTDRAIARANNSMNSAIAQATSPKGDHTVSANLRFAHAETIAPLATLLELEGAATPVDSLVHYPDVWKTDQIMPFSANIQWILYRAVGKPALIKILYNEKPVHLPLQTNIFPYYRYEDLQKLYGATLKRWHIDPSWDMLAYLRESK